MYRWACLVLAAMMPFAAVAKERKAEIDPAVLTEGFLAAHPDLRWRGEALRSYERKEYEIAMTQLLRAARYADKPSQALIAEMYWQGTGVAQDRAIAYAWMDLAAERLYANFLAVREHYWGQLSEAERNDAMKRGQALLAEYGDDVAKSRLEGILRRERRKTTGSRTGFVGNLTIIPNSGPLAGTGMTLRGDQYYAPKYWEPKEYWRLQDEIWQAPIRTRVDVGDVETVKDDDGD
jgi:hypothetical protein